MRKLHGVLLWAIVAAFTAQIVSAQATKDSTIAGTPVPEEVRNAIQKAGEALGMAFGRDTLADNLSRAEYWGSGMTYAVTPGKQGLASQVTDYHVSVDYIAPFSVRWDYVSNAQRNIEVVNIGANVRTTFAWNETEPGGGTITPALTAGEERQLQFWIMNPYSVVKAAEAAGERAKVSKANGATVITLPLARASCLDQEVVRNEAPCQKPQITFPVTFTVTLDSKNLIQKVVTQSNNMVREIAYSDYNDLSESKSGKLFPAHVVQKQGGFPVWDLMITKVDLDHPHVFIVTPDSVRAAAQPPGAPPAPPRRRCTAGGCPETPADRAARAKEAAAKPTPRAADGHPDLTGYWPDPLTFIGEDGIPVTTSADGKTVIYEEGDVSGIGISFKARVADRPKRPPYYKPEFVAKQKELMLNSSRLDPGIACYPLGVPRIGAPSEIVQTPTAVYFLYASDRDEDQAHTFRVIPIGGKHDPNRDPRPDGDSIAFWDGDTLVVDVVNIDPETWLDGDGDFHDENLHVIERFTRIGNTLEYDVTIEDPTLFTEPWKPTEGFIGIVNNRIAWPKTRILRQPGFEEVPGYSTEHAVPDYACVERDREHKVNNDRF